MPDDVTFEARLADALGRYADLAPTMDDDAVAAQAIPQAGRPGLRRLLSLRPGRSRRFHSTGAAGRLPPDRPGPRARRDPCRRHRRVPSVPTRSRPIGRNGTIAFTVRATTTSRRHAPDERRREAAIARWLPNGARSTPRDGHLLAGLAYDGSAFLVSAWRREPRPAALPSSTTRRIGHLCTLGGRDARGLVQAGATGARLRALGGAGPPGWPEGPRRPGDERPGRVPRVAGLVTRWQLASPS